MDFSDFTIPANATLRQAMHQIELNKNGIVFILDQFGSVAGLATDGDIRRKLLNGFTLDDSIASCCNVNYIFGSPLDSRESLLKKLDRQIRTIPLLNKSKKLVGVISRDSFPIKGENKIYARSRAPVRVSFGGGGSDLTNYFSLKAGAVLSTTINLYSHAILRKNQDSRISIQSRDLNVTIEAENLRDLLSQNNDLGLILSLIKVINPEFGFELHLYSDFPTSSGLGGSAAISAAVLGVFNELRHDRWTLYELVEIAYQAERLYLNLVGGWQDQYATVFGGFNFMEFTSTENVVHPLRISEEVMLELEESLVLCDTGLKHDSSDIHKKQISAGRDLALHNLIQGGVDLSYKMRNELLRGRLHQFGKLLDEAWALKRQLGSGVTNASLDLIYQNACKNGAIGGKLLGAGGGGFLLFYCPPFARSRLVPFLEGVGLRIQPFRFERSGMSSWTFRDGVAAQIKAEYEN